MNKIPKEKPVDRKVYKVLIKWDDGDLTSTYAPSENRKKYYVGEKTLPMNGTKLFVFTQLKHARKYVTTEGQQVIYEARATGVYHNGWLSCQLTFFGDLEDAFKDGSYMCPPDKDYESCAVCDSVTLIKQIK